MQDKLSFVRITGGDLTQLRKDLRWSQRDLADHVGISNRSLITRIEAGKQPVPKAWRARIEQAQEAARILRQSV